MSRYIDADRALEDADTIDPKHKTLIEQVKRIINAQPSADVEPVRHGRWLDQQPRYRLYKCSVCNRVCFAEMMGDETELYDYCPYCGARMDGDEE